MIFQKEKCPESGKEHWQGYAEFQRKITLNTVKELFDDDTLHVEKRRGTRQEAREYCMKEDTRVEPYVQVGRWRETNQGQRRDLERDIKLIEEGASMLDMLKLDCVRFNQFQRLFRFAEEEFKKVRGLKALQEEMKDKELNQVQQKIHEKFTNQNNRQITVVVDKQGGIGKTFYSKWLISQQPKNVIYYNNAKTSDIACAYEGQEYAIFDLTRSLGERINWGAIEAIKNGILFSSKYESGCKVGNPKQKVLVLTNSYPDLDKLSLDRWDILNIMERPQREATLQEEWI